MEKETNIEVKKGINVLMLIVMIVGVILLIVGLSYEIPSRTFSFYGLEKYVGGDAYNAIIESSLRGGEISGAMVSKAVYICGGIITMSIGALGIKKK